MQLFSVQKQSHRQSKLEIRLLKFLSELIVKKTLPPCYLEKNKVITLDTFVTITRIHLSGDAKLASIYFRHFSDEKNKEVQTYFQKMSGVIRKAFAQESHARFVPELRFFIDDAYKQGCHVNELINHIKEEI